jgi:hypothetical protein
MNHVNAVRPNPHPIGNHVGQHNQQAQPQNQHIDVLEEEPEPIVQLPVAQRAVNAYREASNEVHSPPARRASQRRQYSKDHDDDEIDISESFLMRLSIQKLYTSYIVIEVKIS